MTMLLTPSVLTSVSCSTEKFIKRDRLEGDDGGDVTGTGLDLSIIPPLTLNLGVFEGRKPQNIYPSNQLQRKGVHWDLVIAYGIVTVQKIHWFLKYLE